MKSYLVSYDLNKPGQDYASLVSALKSYKIWWHHLDSTWVIKSDQTAVEIRDRLKPLIDKGDEILVVRLSGEGAWAGIKSKGSDWLKKHL